MAASSVAGALAPLRQLLSKAPSGRTMVGGVVGICSIGFVGSSVFTAGTSRMRESAPIAFFGAKEPPTFKAYTIEEVGDNPGERGGAPRQRAQPRAGEGGGGGRTTCISPITTCADVALTLDPPPPHHQCSSACGAPKRSVAAASSSKPRKARKGCRDAGRTNLRWVMVLCHAPRAKARRAYLLVRCANSRCTCVRSVCSHKPVKKSFVYITPQPAARSHGNIEIKALRPFGEFV